MLLGLFYTYDAVDYQIAPMNVVENVSWKNAQGFLCNEVVLLDATQQGFVDLIPGRYDISTDALSPLTLDIETDNGLVFSDPIAVDHTANNNNHNLIPGLGLKLKETFYGGERCIFQIGGLWLTEGRFLNLLSWDDSSSLSVKLKNLSGSTLHNCEAFITNRALLSQTTFASPIFSLSQAYGFTPVAGTYTITFANYLAGSPATIQILVNGGVTDVFDVSDVLMQDGKLLKCDGTTVYHFANGTLLEGITFILDDATNNSSTATIAVSPGASIWEIGNPGDIAIGNLVIGNVLTTDEIPLVIACSPQVNATAGANYGLLQFYTDEGTISVGLTAELQGSFFELLDNPLSLRCFAMDQNLQSTFMEFGVIS